MVNDDKNLVPRPPIVAVMGHVDHGKTKLLDTIRKTNVAEQEIGGITQAVGAYEIIHTPYKPQSTPAENRKITFIDTPGHEAFGKMRAHGARVADIAILVVAADDGVKPQTKDALQAIRNANIPFLVAINKIDKPEANIEKTLTSIAEAGVYLEGRGGDISYQLISAKTGEGIAELLDLILLIADLKDLRYNPNAPASGIVLTSYTDPREGITVGAVVKDGTLKPKEQIATETAKGKIKILKNFKREQVSELQPSSPALIFGFENLPDIGEEFITGSEAKHRKKTAKKLITVMQKPQNETGESKKQNVILKADETGSLEALRHIIENKFSESVNIIDTRVGNITETDTKRAFAAHAIILGFKTKMDDIAEQIIKSQKTTVIASPVIYELENLLGEYLARGKHAEEARSITILDTFGKPPAPDSEKKKTATGKGKQQIVGGTVVKGPIKNGELFEVWNGEKKIGTGKIINLRSGKVDTPSAEEGKEVGLLVESNIPIEKGFKLVFSNTT